MTMTRYGATAHLSPTGELDLAARAALDQVRGALDGVAVAACDMRHLTFLDVVGLHALIDFAHRLDDGGIAFFTYNWQPQPHRLLNLVDGLDAPTTRSGRPSRGPTQLLRRSPRDAATAHHAPGPAAAMAGEDPSETA
ncbi:STAS domain-containing protein [Streptomyces goshikiensis]|uniref:STAS domain-containing protein n=1 Tax=Streptomyces goshikiensis TaxID=1942 RepID=UPI00371553A8